MDSPLTYVERSPSAPLNAIADAIWYLRGPSPQRFETILPLPFTHLIVNLADPYTVVRRGEERRDEIVRGPFISGIQSTFLVNENPADLEHVGVRLRASGLHALTTAVLNDRVVEAEPFLPGVIELGESFRGMSPDASLEAFEAWLVSRIRPEWQPNPLVEATLDRIHSEPTVRMADLARELGTTPKTLIANVKRHCGLTPKRYADLYRHFEFVQAVPDAPPFPSWAEMVAQAGYYDQPHFIRVFAKFTGMTPRDYLRSKSQPGSAPSFLASETG